MHEEEQVWRAARELYVASPSSAGCENSVRIETFPPTKPQSKYAS